MNEVNDELTCHICQKTFPKNWNKNRHLKDVHHVEVEKKKSTVHMKCPLCPEEEKKPFDSHEILSTHLEEIHSVSIKTTLLNFRNEEEFEAWRALDNRTDNYTKRGSKNTKDGRLLYYECNRSNFSGYTSQCSKRSMKAGGSIKISGFCPSRIHVKFSSTGVSVKYVETHVGHKDELRSKHLSKNQQEMIAGKLMCGVTKERILEEARTVEKDKLERINVLSRGDLAYISRKFNIDKRRHDDDDMVATALKVKEWNSQGKNDVFLFKQIGVGTSMDEDNNLYVCEPSTSRAAYEMDVQHFLKETKQNSDISVDSSTKIDIIKEQAIMKFRSLDEAAIIEIAKQIDEKYNLMMNTSASTSKKRKIEKQIYFPSNK